MEFQYETFVSPFLRVLNPNHVFPVPSSDLFRLNVIPYKSIAVQSDSFRMCSKKNCYLNQTEHINIEFILINSDWKFGSNQFDPELTPIKTDLLYFFFNEFTTNKIQNVFQIGSEWLEISGNSFYSLGLNSNPKLSSVLSFEFLIRDFNPNQFFPVPYSDSFTLNLIRYKSVVDQSDSIRMCSN